VLSEVIIEDGRWQAVGLEELVERAGRATLLHVGLDPDEWEISILACNDTRISELNGDFRDKPQATNVLSWPNQERAAADPGATPPPPMRGQDPELGDIAIAYDYCNREAEQSGTPFSDHVTHLIVHAVLHLLGYDHVRDQDATLMETIETAILGKLGVPDPY